MDCIRWKNLELVASLNPGPVGGGGEQVPGA